MVGELVVIVGWVRQSKGGRPGRTGQDGRTADPCTRPTIQTTLCLRTYLEVGADEEPHVAGLELVADHVPLGPLDGAPQQRVLRDAHLWIQLAGVANVDGDERQNAHHRKK